MAYFTYKVNEHLLVPKNVFDLGINLEYPPGAGAISSAKNPFLAADMHLNFFNLAKSAVDATSRIAILESLSKDTLSEGRGYVAYNGKQEAAGKFYGGSPYKQVGGVLASVLPRTLVADESFRFAIGAGVNTTSLQAGSEWITITIPSTTVLSNVSTINTFLKNNTLTPGDGFRLTGQADVTSDWANTFGTITPTIPASFIININFGEQSKVVTLSEAFASQDVGLLVTRLQGAIDVAVGAGAITVTNSGGLIRLTGNPDRATGGCAAFSIESPSSGNSIAFWLGLESTTPHYAYDLTSIVSFKTEGSNVTLEGTDPYARFSLWNNADTGVATFLDKIGFNTYNVPQVYYHTMEPYHLTGVVNFGGDIKARKGYFQELSYVNASFTGQTAFDSIVSTSLAVSGGCLIEGSSVFENILTEALTASELSTLSGNVILGTNSSNTLTVNSASTFAENVTLSAGKTLTTPNLTVSGTLSANSANLSLSSLTTSGNINSSGAITASGNITASGTGTVSGNKLYARTPTSGTGTAVVWDTVTKEIVTSTSDSRAKTDIRPIEGSMEVIKSLSPVRYKFIEEYGGFESLGFVAQELRKYVPEAVFGDENKEMLSVNLIYILPHIVKALQHLTERVEAIEKH